MNDTTATAAVLDYIKEQYGAEPEFLWSRTPGNAALRHKDSRKWFAAIMLNLPRKTLGLADSGQVDVLNLKCEPLLIGSLLDGRRYLPGYHMNKEHWITVLLDGSVLLDEICPLIDMSFHITDKKR